ncbi:MAG: metalloregulator ArsR/SmtB family transcription factor [Candidatus Poseidoniia archaeon]|nr:metalloregulator ArsR/SmtB family transcription factor [Candidatus Poseidoniia archaeon]
MNSIIFKALGSETRLKIIEHLIIKEHNVTDLTKISGKDQTTISRHLANLKQASIISQKKIGRNVIYAISNEEMKNWLNLAINIKTKNEEIPLLRNKIKDFLIKQRK